MPSSCDDAKLGWSVSVLAGIVKGATSKQRTSEGKLLEGLQEFLESIKKTNTIASTVKCLSEDEKRSICNCGYA